MPGKVIKKKPEPKMDELTITPMETVSVKIKAATEFSKEAIEIFVARQQSANKDTGETIDALIALIQDKVNDYAHEQNFYGEEVEDEVEVGEDEEVEEVKEEEVEDEEDFDEDEDEEEESEEEVDEELLTEEDILAMNKPKLIELIEDEGLDIDPKEYKKLADLKQAIIDELFEEEEAEEEEESDSDDDDWDDSDWDDEK